MGNVSLPPDLEQFATEAIAAGRYATLDDVLAAGLSLLRQAEAERAAFIRTLDDAYEEAERDGWVTLDEVMAEADRIIAAKSA